MPKMLLDAVVTERGELIKDVFMLSVKCLDIAKIAKPGNFIQLKPQGKSTLLRRPLGVANVFEDYIVFIYRKLGKGTKELSELKHGDTVSLLGPLGNAFTDFKHPLLVGGGMGLSPLLFYAKEHRDNIGVLMGGRTSEELFWEKFFAKYSNDIFVATEDGSKGEKGFNVDLLPNLLKGNKYDGVIACGPEPMMKKAAQIAKEYNIPVEVSLEKRMGCGLGACLSCAIDTVNGRKKVCKDGPVFKGEEVFF